MPEFTALIWPEEKRPAETGNPPGEHRGWGPFIPVMTDVYFDDVVYVWARLLPGGSWGDLDLELYDGPSIGEMPEWFSDYGEWLDGALIRYRCGTPSSITWALENGIAPGQPFLLEVGPPRSYRCSWEYDEWDVDYDVGLVRVLPNSIDRAARSWLRELKNYQRAKDAWEDYQAKKRHLEDLKKNKERTS